MHLLNPALSTSAAYVPFPTNIVENQKSGFGPKKGGRVICRINSEYSFIGLGVYFVCRAAASVISQLRPDGLPGVGEHFLARNSALRFLLNLHRPLRRNRRVTVRQLGKIGRR